MTLGDEHFVFEDIYETSCAIESLKQHNFTKLKHFKIDGYCDQESFHDDYKNPFFNHTNNTAAQ